VPQIFLADSIENGAGFTTWLREPGRFAQLIEDCLELIATDWDDPAIHDCGSSCPAAFETGQTRRITRSSIGESSDVLAHGAVQRDRWGVVRSRAVEKVAADFNWTVIERGARPILDSGSGLICVVHPLEPVDGHLDAGVPTDHGPALPFDCFNFDRRPGEVFRRL
jgi:hypothetical protein